MSLLQLLNEDKKDRLIQRFKNQLESISSSDSITHAEKIVDSDLSATKKYSEWGVKNYIETCKNPPSKYNWMSPFNIHSIVIKVLKQYHNIIENLSPEKVKNMFDLLDLIGHFSSDSTEEKIKKNPKDINSFEKLEDLEYFIFKYEDYLLLQKQEKEIKNEAERVYEDNRFLIVRPLTHKASCYYGAQTKWCTTAKNNDFHFKDYTSKGRLYYIIDKKSSDGTYSKMALLLRHGKGAKEVYNQQDTPETYDYLLRRFEPIADKIKELSDKNEDYEVIKKVKSNPLNSHYETLDSLNFDRFEGEKVIFNFGEDLQEFLQYFEDDIPEDSLGFYDFYYSNSQGNMFYNYDSFSSDMSDGMYPLYNLNEEHIQILKSIVEILNPSLLENFEGEGLSDDENRSKIAEFLKTREKLYSNFESDYISCMDGARHDKFKEYIKSDICEIYKDIGLKKLDDSPCFSQYEISVDTLLEYYEEDEKNKKLSVGDLIKKKVSSDLYLDSYPENVYEYDNDSFTECFDDDMTKYLNKELSEIEDDSDIVQNSQQYRRILNYITKNFGLNQPKSIKTSENDIKISFQGVDPQNNKIIFKLIRPDGEEKMGKAQLSTIIKLLNNYTLFDPF